jgi:hypothetical protein
MSYRGRPQIIHVDRFRMPRIARMRLGSFKKDSFHIAR